MSTSIAGAHRSPNTRTVRKVEAPRPLKASMNEVKPKSTLSSVSLAPYSIESIEKLVTVLETVANAIAQSDESGIVTAETTSLLTSNIIHLCNHLKTYGPQLENSLYQGQLDRAFLIFRDAMVRGSLEYLARVHLLDILELRERSWIPQQTHSPAKNFQKPLSTISLLPESDFNDIKSLPTHYSFTANEMPVNLAANEVIRRSGKHREKSSRIPSKNYCKDEIVIRNSDSGKVMGIKGRRVHMIEQLSETVISFQRVTPTAKERLVQITGPNEEKISYAEKLIEETIRNNSSPVRGLFESDSSYSSEDSSPEHLGGEDYDITHEHATVGKLKSFSQMNNQPYQYKHKVIVSNCQLTITGDDYTYVTVAKAVLDDYFSKLRKSEWSAEDLAGGDTGKMKELHPNSAKSVSKIMISNSVKDFQLSEPLDVNSAMLLSHTSVTSEPVSLTETSDVLSSPNTQACEVDRVDLSIISDDVRVDPLPLFAKSNIDQESKTMYSKELLMKLRESELSHEKPNNWELILQKFPNLVKSSENAENVIISV